MRTPVFLPALTILFSAPAYAQHAGHAPPSPAPRAEALPAQTIFPPQESAGEVTLSLAPRWSDGRLVLLLAASTQSVDLTSIDLKQAMRLVVNGISIAPASADSLAGHHARARVVFPLASKPEAFTIEIRGVPDVELRTMQWPAPHQSGH